MATQTIGYLPGQDPGDMQANQEYQQALQRMLASLDARKNRMFDPTMLAMAEGFLKPTKTGSFGEGLANAVAGARQAQDAEAKFEQDFAQQRLALAGQGLNLQRQKARERAFEGMMRPTPAGSAGEPSEVVPGAPAGPVAGATAPAGAGEVAGRVAQAPPERFGTRIAPPRQFQTREQFMAAQRMDPSISPAQAMKAWEDYEKGMTEVREGGVFDRRTGMFYQTPKADQVNRQIYGSTYPVPLQVALELDEAQASGDEQRYRAIADRVLRGPGGLKSIQQSEVEKAGDLERAKVLATEAAKREANVPKARDTALQIRAASDRIMRDASMFPEVFGVFEQPGIAAAFATLIDEGLSVGTTRVNMGGFRKAVTQAAPRMSQDALNALMRFAGNKAELELLFRQKYLAGQGQGAISNMEQAMIPNMIGSEKDTAEVLQDKLRLLSMRAQVDLKFANKWNEMSRANRRLTYLQFEKSPEYDKIVDEYSRALNREFSSRYSEQPPAAARQAPPRPAAARRQPAAQGQPYGNASRRVDQFLRGD
jgi:hypothetical protein